MEKICIFWSKGLGLFPWHSDQHLGKSTMNFTSKPADLFVKEKFSARLLLAWLHFKQGSVIDHATSSRTLKWKCDFCLFDKISRIKSPAFELKIFWRVHFIEGKTSYFKILRDHGLSRLASRLTEKQFSVQMQSSEAVKSVLQDTHSLNSSIGRPEPTRNTRTTRPRARPVSGEFHKQVKTNLKVNKLNIKNKQMLKWLIKHSVWWFIW